MLKKQPGFVLKKIKDSYYLLPFGQQVADQKKGLFLNETGAFLWECLCDTTKHAELVKKLAGHYQLEESDFPMLEEDVTLFLNQLTSFDILKDDGDSAVCADRQNFFQKNFLLLPVIPKQPKKSHRKSI